MITWFYKCYFSLSMIYANSGKTIFRSLIPSSIGLVYYLTISPVNAQSLLWGDRLGGSAGQLISYYYGTYEEACFAITSDDSGNTYATGTFKLFSNIVEPGNGFNLNSDLMGVYVVKFDPSGNVLWAVDLGGETFDIGYDMAINSQGELIVVGCVSGDNIDFDPGSGLQNYYGSSYRNSFIWRLSSDGELNWSGVFRCNNEANIAHSIWIDPATDDYFITGEFEGNTDFDPSEGTLYVNSQNSARKCYVVKMKNTNELEWVRVSEGNSSNYGMDIIGDSNGDLIICGHFNGSVDFDPGDSNFNLSSLGMWDAFVLKLNSDGDFIWARSAGGATWDDMYYSVSTDQVGNIYTAGYFGSQNMIATGIKNQYEIESSGAEDAIICCYSSNGELNWAKSIGGPGKERLLSLSVDQNGVIYSMGFFHDHISIDTSESTIEFDSAGESDILIANWAPNGTCIQAKVLGSVGNDAGHAISVDNMSHVYYGGVFSNTMNIALDDNPMELYSQGGIDSWFAKYSQCSVSYLSQVIEACNEYVVPNTPLSFTQSGVFYSVNDEGIECESVTLNEVIIHESNFEPLTRFACTEFTWDANGATYDASGIYEAVLVNSNGCDSISQLNLTIGELNAQIVQNGNTLFAEEYENYLWIECGEGLEIPVGTSQTFNPTEEGFYMLVVLEESCVDTSECYDFQFISVSEHDFTSEFIVYPNPADAWAIAVGVLNCDVIHVINVLGEIVYSTQVFGNSVELNFSGLSEGMYFVASKSGALRILVTHGEKLSR